MNKATSRRERVRQQRAKVAGTWQRRVLALLWSWPMLTSLLFLVAVSIINLLGEVTLGYSVGQRLEHPIHARVEFQVRDAEQTMADRAAARAATPSYYTLNAASLTFDRVRADLMRVYQAAVDAQSFEEYSATLRELNGPAVESAYNRLHAMADDSERARFQAWVDQLPLETEYVVRGVLREDRDPKSSTDFIRVETHDEDGSTRVVDVPHAELVPQGNERALRGSAAQVAKRFRLPELVTTVETVVLSAFREQPTIVFDRRRTREEMQRAADGTPEAVTVFEAGQALAGPGVLGPDEYRLLRAENRAYQGFLGLGTPDAERERGAVLLRRSADVALVVLISIGLLAYTGLHHRRVFEIGSRTLAFMVLILATTLGARLLVMNWPDLPELVYAPCLVAGGVLAIAYPRRFAMGVMCIVALLITTMIGGRPVFLLALLTGVVVTVFQLGEIRSRSKLIATGAITTAVVMVASAAGGLSQGDSYEAITRHAVAAGSCVMLASFIVSGVLPLIERWFGIATYLTLLEWRDPTRQLLQLLAQEAPGTYSHSLVLGTLAEAACEAIRANGLLAQVGALYHDIGKIPKAAYFTENQAGRISRHENLAPNMSLLIILGHVKDGIEMAKEYKLPRVLHQFIAEHHGTTVVRYFHYMATEKQPQIASGRHDREVPEAEFRYGGPKPRSRESAVLMLCDGAEGAVRALPEPTASRVEAVVHQIVMDRLNDGQFDDCEITLKELFQVEEALAKSLCSIYHGRVAYPKPRKQEAEESTEREKVTV
jgi:putative nucleotidyltransferase with HDIG domain